MLPCHASKDMLTLPDDEGLPYSRLPRPAGAPHHLQILRLGNRPNALLQAAQDDTPGGQVDAGSQRGRGGEHLQQKCKCGVGGAHRVHLRAARRQPGWLAGWWVAEVKTYKYDDAKPLSPKSRTLRSTFAVL